MYKVILLIAFLLCRNYGGPQLSQQNQKPHGKTKNLTAKPKTSPQTQKPHGKSKNLTAKTKYVTTKPKPSRQNQRPHGKTKYFTAKTKYLTAKANTHGKTKAILVLQYLVLTWGILFLPWGFWFCREVFGFAVMFLFLPWGFWFCRDSLGHRKKLQTRQLYRLTVNTSAYLARIQTSTHPPYTPTHFYQ